jgi:hypothetical protein
LRALLDGLLMTVELNIPFLEIEMDSLVAVDLILATHPANAFLRSIVSDCRCLLQKFEGVSIKHIYREANMCADLLAKAGCDQLEDFVLFCFAIPQRKCWKCCVLTYLLILVLVLFVFN